MLRSKLCLGIFLVLFVYGCAAGRGGLSQPPSSDEISAARRIGSPIAFSTTHAEINSANGLDVMITWENVTNKVIKYCYVQVCFKNNVDDPVRGEISGKKYAVLEYVGPFKPGDKNWGGRTVHTDVMYNPTATTVQALTVWCKYMDGSESIKLDVTGLPSTSGQVKPKIVY